jgi:hypothetical protein
MVGDTIVAPEAVTLPVKVGAESVRLVNIAPEAVTVPVRVGAESVGETRVAPEAVTVPVRVGAESVGETRVAPEAVTVPVKVGFDSVLFVSVSVVAVPTIVPEATPCAPTVRASCVFKFANTPVKSVSTSKTACFTVSPEGAASTVVVLV